MNRVSISELRAVFEYYVKVVNSLGVDTREYYMVEGSATEGQSYRIRNKGVNPIGITSDGIIGDTRREAVKTMRDITAGLKGARAALLGFDQEVR